MKKPPAAEASGGSWCLGRRPSLSDEGRGTVGLLPDDEDGHRRGGGDLHRGRAHDGGREVAAAVRTHDEDVEVFAGVFGNRFAGVTEEFDPGRREARRLEEFKRGVHGVLVGLFGFFAEFVLGEKRPDRVEHVRRLRHDVAVVGLGVQNPEARVLAEEFGVGERHRHGGETVLGAVDRDPHAHRVAARHRGFGADEQKRTLGLRENAVRDGAQEVAHRGVEAARPHHDEVGVDAVGFRRDRLTRVAVEDGFLHVGPELRDCVAELVEDLTAFGFAGGLDALEVEEADHRFGDRVLDVRERDVRVRAEHRFAAGQKPEHVAALFGAVDGNENAHGRSSSSAVMGLLDCLFPTGAGRSPFVPL